MFSRAALSFVLAASLFACKGKASAPASTAAAPAGPDSSAAAPAAGAPASSAAPAAKAAPAAGTEAAPKAAEAPTPKYALDFVEKTSFRADPKDPLPMVIAVHGYGDSPEAFSRFLAKFDKQARLIFPRGTGTAGRGHSWFPIRMRDKDPEGMAKGISAAAKKIADLARALAKDRPTLGKPVVTGFSQGGMVSFAVAVEHPDAVSAALPLGGWLPPPLWPKEMPAAAPPIYAFHGEADNIVPFGPTKAAVEALKKLGYDANLRAFPGVRHALPAKLRTDYFARLRVRVDAARGQ